MGEAGSQVEFHLLYEELLQRRSGLYHYQAHLNPPPSLQSLSLELMVEEQRSLTHVAVPTIRDNSVEGEEKMVEEVAMVREGPGRARVTYRPNMKDLEKLGKSLQFLLEYDVERVAGEGLLMDGHFVHFLAPDQLPVLKQHVVFVIDSSGSMSGRKMEQTKNAMAAILGQIGPTDFFSIIDFDSEVKDVLMAMEGTQKNIEDAVEAVNSIEARGGTNIRDALMRALEIVDQAEMKELQPLIVFLTDGQPSTGITDPTQIQADVAARNRRGLAIFSLAFGTGADFEMLQKLSLQNHGFARKIYEGGDAAIQLEGSTEKWPVPFCQESSSTMWGTQLRRRHSQKRHSTPSTRGARWWWLEDSQEVKGLGLNTLWKDLERKHTASLDTRWSLSLYIQVDPWTHFLKWQNRGRAKASWRDSGHSSG